jgi:hypothetical protein
VSSRLNVVKGLKRTNEIVSLEKVDIWLAYRESQSGFTWPESIASYEQKIYQNDYRIRWSRKGLYDYKIRTSSQIFQSVLAMINNSIVFSLPC